VTAAVEDFPPLEIVEEEKPKRTRKPRDPDAPRVVRKSTQQKLADELLEPWALFGKALGAISPTGGAIAVMSGEDVTRALVQVASKHPKMLAALRNISEVSPIAELAQFAAVLILAIGVDFGKVDPYAPLPRIVGITDVYEEMRSAMQPEPEPGVGGDFEFLKPPPPAFPGEMMQPDGTFVEPAGWAARPGAAFLND
jgi:hypothetical protein